MGRWGEVLAMIPARVLANWVGVADLVEMPAKQRCPSCVWRDGDARRLSKATAAKRRLALGRFFDAATKGIAPRNTGVDMMTAAAGD